MYLYQSAILTEAMYDDRAITSRSKYSVKETIDIIERTIKEQNGIVFCRINQRKAAEDAGIVGQLDDTELLIFGNPQVGTQLMVENASVSFELPLRATCWRKNNTVYVGISNPEAWEIPYNLGSKKPVLERMKRNIMDLIQKVSLWSSNFKE